MWGGAGFPPFGPNFGDDPYEQAAAPAGAFTRQFRCYPVSFIDKSELENGDKIVLPPSALDSLARLNIAFPMLFQLESRQGRKTHCGVQEFIAEEGHANVPYWLMQNLLVTEGGMITIRNANLPKGTFVKFQPQTSDFLKISNPKAVLEATLRSFTCLTKGDSIAINYNNKVYYIDVLEVAPGEAISIIETDVNVEFAAPKDYVEPEPPKAVNAPAGTDKGIQMGQASGHPSSRLKDRLEMLKKRMPVEEDSDSSDDDKPQPQQLFPGSGQTLKAKSKSSGLVFGGPSSDTGTAAEGNNKGTEEKEKKPFVPFGGEGRSLR
ncbi:Ubiquitin fusion degradation protein 1-like [Gracilariopsis chorda]|uniref:Ubiquitin fusion degradation protein 1-like n=1 Tax=Gracilariopsis chorda TaxID=448386 RepID=A0A2V3II79_9FLOR|nr:Ubiquitin fusion degradation protein 1-like [Gracilariopsis chorda]|eukprot:PXF40850.1 Ubiquitin fusion degradation protein 1-like [Gracilariopsis chorda]